MKLVLNSLSQLKKCTQGFEEANVLYPYREQGKKKVIPPGIEPGTLSVLDSRDNRYTMESTYIITGIYHGAYWALFLKFKSKRANPTAGV